MRAVISIADERFSCLYKMLAEKGFDITQAKTDADFQDKDTAILKYPFDSVSQAGINRLTPGAKVFVLAVQPLPTEITQKFRVISLMDDPGFVDRNAYITAEGAVFSAMKHAPFVLSGEKIAVIGFGRIGRALTEILVGLKANVTVFSRRESGRLSAMARGAMGASVERLVPLLSDFRIIFVTSPDRMIGDREIKCISDCAFLFDLSGAPYGVDADAAEKEGVFLRREGALPGRYAPESAAKAMYQVIVSQIGGDGL